jgi:hypothetical protein
MPRSQKGRRIVMSYAKPVYERSHVNAAGGALREYFSSADIELSKEVTDIVDNWRSSHSYPLNAFTMTLKNRDSRISEQVVVSQRIKRLSSIALKLIDRGDMKLTQMQDIGGCRAVLPSVENVSTLRDVYMNTRMPHKLSGGGEKDYIAFPKASGYRSIHLKYRFAARVPATDAYSSLKIEIQLRSLLQHRWATAGEAVGTFTHAALKSSKGDPHWLRFFALMSSVLALREGCPVVPGTSETFHDLRHEIRELDLEHRIEPTFSQFHALLPKIENERDASYYLVSLDPEAGTVAVKGYKRGESQLANKEYIELEKKLPQGTATQIVLVSVQSIAALRRAYPNYFLDTADFLNELRELLYTQGV